MSDHSRARECPPPEWLVDEAHAPARAQVAAHLAVCEECAAEVASLRALGATVNTADADVSERLPDDLWEQVRSAREPAPSLLCRAHVIVADLARRVRASVDAIDAATRSAPAFGAVRGPDDGTEAAARLVTGDAEEAVDTLVVVRPGRVRLTVTRNGAPVSGARVSLASTETEADAVGGTTDDTGTCVLSGMSPGGYVVEVEVRR